MAKKNPAPAGAGSPPELADVPFEKALDELEHIVDDLEGGTLSLEDALGRFERGIQLSRHLEKQLREAEARVQRLVGGDTESPILAPFKEGEPIEEPMPDDDGDEDDDGGRLPF